MRLHFGTRKASEQCINHSSEICNDTECERSLYGSDLLYSKHLLAAFILIHQIPRRVLNLGLVEVKINLVIFINVNILGLGKYFLIT